MRVARIDVSQIRTIALNKDLHFMNQLSTRLLASATVLALSVSLAGCGKGLNGTYTDPTGKITYAFHSNGTVDCGIGGMSKQFNYVLKGDEIHINTGGVDRVLRRDSDGAVIVPPGVKLVAKK
jgi:hypothetical protein